MTLTYHIGGCCGVYQSTDEADGREQSGVLILSTTRFIKGTAVEFLPGLFYYQASHLGREFRFADPKSPPRYPRPSDHRDHSTAGPRCLYNVTYGQTKSELTISNSYMVLTAGQLANYREEEMITELEFVPVVSWKNKNSGNRLALLVKRG